MVELTPHQKREISMAIKHVHRAMRAVYRANLPDLSDVDMEDRSGLLEIHQGYSLLGKASDSLIDGMMIHQGEMPNRTENLDA